MTARSLGLGHVDHPLLGRRVFDTATGRAGILRAVTVEKPPVGPGIGPRSVTYRAWLSPEVGGGYEWTTRLDRIEEAR